MIYLGIDPGSPLTLGALTDKGTIYSIHEYEEVATSISYLTKGKNAAVQWANNPALIASIIRSLSAEDDLAIVVEQVSIRPGEAIGPAQKFVGSMWLSLGAAAGVGVSCVKAPPSVWKREMGIKTTLRNPKEPSRLKALELWPDRADLFKRKKDHNRAEALLLAEWLRRKGADYAG